MAKLQQSKTDEYFAGQILIGDDYSLDQIQDWYQQESEAYANLGSKDKKNYSYSYHNQNILNGFNCLGKEGKYDNALGFGSAYGYEFFPIITQIRKLTIVEPSDNLRSDKIGDLIPVYVKPTATGLYNSQIIHLI